MTRLPRRNELDDPAQIFLPGPAGALVPAGLADWFELPLDGDYARAAPAAYGPRAALRREGQYVVWRGCAEIACVTRTEEPAAFAGAVSGTAWTPWFGSHYVVKPCYLRSTGASDDCMLTFGAGRVWRRGGFDQWPQGRPTYLDGRGVRTFVPAASWERAIVVFDGVRYPVAEPGQIPRTIELNVSPFPGQSIGYVDALDRDTDPVFAELGTHPNIDGSLPPT